jgi:flagellar motility protein MotE (MotC chaperone)
MSQFFSGFLKLTLGMALACFIFWGLVQFGVIDSKTLILQAASLFPDLRDLPQSYELGKKRNQLLAEKEAELRRLEERLKEGQSQLAADRNQLNEDQNKWQNAHPAAKDTSQYLQAQNIVNPPMPGKFPPPTPEQKLKDYLIRVGTMKPKQAAAVIQKLPEETVFAIFDQLRPYQVTKIMENLPEAYLAKLTQDRLTKYRNI